MEITEKQTNNSLFNFDDANFSFYMCDTVIIYFYDRLLITISI